MGQNSTRGGQVLVHVSIYQGKPFWIHIFDPQPIRESLQPELGYRQDSLDQEGVAQTSGAAGCHVHP